jgi:hypothetical protein
LLFCHLVLNKRSTCEVVFGGNFTQASQALTATASLFDDSHSGLLRGVEFLGVVQISKMGTLNQMLSVIECRTQLSIMLRGHSG